jgi:hypothetical protein
VSATQPAAAPRYRFPFPLQPDEKVLQLCRRHWWHLWPKSIIWAAFAIVPVAVLVPLLSRLDVLDDLGIVFWIIAAVWLVYWAVRLLLNWYRYHNDIWVITDQRVIDSFKPHPFQTRVATADLVNVQDMAVEKNGVIPTMLNFGDVVCQTAATGQQFRIAGVPRPESVQLLVDRERDRERQRYGRPPDTA